MSDEEKIKEKLYQIFGEKYVDIKEDGGCIIHFPKITITNSKNDEHTITDLYIQLGWRYDSNRNVSIFYNTLKGIRLSFSPVEIYKGYIHSHLPTLDIEEEEEEQNVRISFTDFCLGSDGISVVLASLNLQFTIDNFIILLNFINDFIRWESLEGGPYIEMTEVQDAINEYTSVDMTSYISVDKQEVAEHFITTVPEYFIKKLYFVLNLDSVTILNSLELLEEWEKIYSEDPYYSLIVNPAIKYNNTYYVENEDYSEILNYAENINLTGSFFFKGKNRFPKINFTGSNNNIKIEKGVRVVHPALFRIIIEIIGNRLHIYLTDKTN